MSGHDNDHHCAHHGSENNNMSGLIAGALIGAAAAYLFGTEKGKKLKAELIEEGQKLLERIGNEIESAQLKTQQEQIKGKIAQTIDKAEDVVESLSEVPEHIAEVQKKGRKFFFKRHSSPARRHAAES